MRAKSFFLLLISCSLLLSSGCGFHPVHGTLGRDAGSQSADAQLAQIAIGGIPDYEGQFLRNALIDRFYQDGRPAAPRYSLSVEKINESHTDLDITKTSDATRGQLRLDTSIRLSDTATGQILLERKLRSITSYNILAGEFATRVSEKNTRENALNDLARQIELQLKLYFNRMP